MSELLESMEHAGHAGHEEHGEGHDDHGHGGPAVGKKKNISKYVGLTMAILGVMMAVCSALVGMTRTELIATMVEKTDTSNRAQAVSSKYRLMQSQLQSTHAFLQTDPEASKKKELQIDEIEKAASTSPSAPAVRVVRLETANLMDAVLPSTDDVVAMAKTTKRYKAEREAADKWAESYEDKVTAYEGRGEHYEWAQLCAEIGVVLASIALLLSSKLAWGGSITLGLSSMTLIVFTFMTSKGSLGTANEEITKAEEAYKETSNEKVDDAADDKLIEETLKMAEAAQKAEAAKTADAH